MVQASGSTRFLGSSGQGAASNPWSNIGSLENKGVELTLNTVNIDTKDFQWRSNFVFSLNRNKVVEMDTETGSLPYSPASGFRYTNRNQLRSRKTHRTVLGI